MADTAHLQTFELSGDWTLTHAARPGQRIKALAAEFGSSGATDVDVSGLTAVDTAGAAAIAAFVDPSRLKGGTSGNVAVRRNIDLIQRVAESRAIAMSYQPDAKPRRNPFARIGHAVAGLGAALRDAMTLQGRILYAAATAFSRQGGLRFTAVVSQFDRMIFQAVPIIALMTFLVGGIVTQQSIFQLRTFGATIFVADLAGILMLREVGVLLAAILIAGRSGSAITAELGSMRMREEVDALQVMGLDPHKVLLLPRVLALVIGLPLLAFIAAAAGLAGASVVAYIYGDIPFATFFDRLRDAVTLKTFLTGLIKAPFMAAIIGLIACLEGMAVGGSSESLGRHTTASVVKSIFMVIVADGMFAMFFAAINF
jgi:phospholipid/cholesterol/gamma-HCH transport system permease protein